MLDNEIKKLLTELKMEDLIDTLEGASNNKDKSEHSQEDPSKMQSASQTNSEDFLSEVELKNEPGVEKDYENAASHAQTFDPDELDNINFSQHKNEAQNSHATTCENPEIKTAQIRQIISKPAATIVKSTTVLLAIACTTLVPAAYMFWKTPHDVADNQTSLVTYNDSDKTQDDEDMLSQEAVVPAPISLQQERESAAASHAQQIVEINEDDGKRVHLLWDMLRRRKEDLQEVTAELTKLLNENARFRQDFYSQSANVLLSRYQAIDARHSVEIANQINALYAHIKQSDNPDLTQAYAEMLGELGAEAYSLHQIQIAKELLQQESMCEQALMLMQTSSSLAELEYNLRAANQVIKALETNGLMQTFQTGQEYQAMMAQNCKEMLNKLLVEDNKGVFNHDARALVEAVLVQVGASKAEIQRYTDKFDSLSKPVEVKPATNLQVAAILQ